ncbi:alcohol oxidase [Serendipita vermifera]|nr:alcohol oxidase [Serendipita vermifera]
MYLSYSAVLLLTAIATPTWAGLVKQNQVKSKYDFIIVGGGTSGLVVANRLSATGSKSLSIIGELDAGEDSVKIPRLALEHIEPKYQFNITTVPQPQLDNRAFPIYAAHVVGGGSTINGMFFDRGSKGDYNLWRDIDRSQAKWGWDDLLPKFTMSETFHLPPSEISSLNVTFDIKAHGTGGPIHSSYPPFLFPATRKFLDVFSDVNITVQRDGGSGNLGAFWIPNTLDPASMTRSYARSAYWDPVSRRPNLDLLTGNKVTKIIFDRNKRAVQVEYASSRNGARSTVGARSEIIIAAGSQHTPQILMLSGIGDKDTLGSLRIPVISDLPGVGQNLQDHPAFTPNGSFTNDLTPNPGYLKDDIWNNEQFQLYNANKTGVYTTSVANEGAFLPLSQVTDKVNQIIDAIQRQNPAEYLLPRARRCLVDGVKKQRDLILKGIKDSNIAFAEYVNGITPSTPVALQKPFSRGFISINSTDAFSDPVIDFRTFTNPVDLDIMVEMFKFWRKLLTTQTWKGLGANEIAPGPNVTSDDQIRAYIKSNAVPTIAHPCCTAAMMPAGLGGVVCPELKVYGVDGLSIVDASIMPIIPSTHPVATVYAIAEKAAEIIKYRHRLF